MSNGIIIRVSGVQVPPPLPKFQRNRPNSSISPNYSGLRIRFIVCNCQSVCFIDELNWNNLAQRLATAKRDMGN